MNFFFDKTMTNANEKFRQNNDKCLVKIMTNEKFRQNNDEC